MILDLNIWNINQMKEIFICKFDIKHQKTNYSRKQRMIRNNFTTIAKYGQ